jgi:hypothetical protein
MENIDSLRDKVDELRRAFAASPTAENVDALKAALSKLDKEYERLYIKKLWSIKNDETHQESPDYVVSGAAR